MKALIYLLALGFLWVVLSKFEKNKIINCKTCGKEISKKARSCPHCGERNNNPLNTVLNIGLVILIIYTVFNLLQPQLLITLVPIIE